MCKPENIGKNGRPLVNELREIQFVDGKSEQFAPVGESLIFRFDEALGHTYWGQIKVYWAGDDISVWLEGEPPSGFHQGPNYSLETFN